MIDEAKHFYLKHAKEIFERSMQLNKEHGGMIGYDGRLALSALEFMWAVETYRGPGRPQKNDRKA